MKPLYQLASEYEQLLSAADDGIDVADALSEVQGDVVAKTTNIAMVLATIDATVAACRAEEQRLSARRKVLEANGSRLRDYVKTCMQIAGVNKVSSPGFSVTLSPAADKVIVDDESTLPPECWREKVTREVDKALILKAYREFGEIPPGCRIEPNTSLRIR